MKIEDIKIGETYWCEWGEGADHGIIKAHDGKDRIVVKLDWRVEEIVVPPTRIIAPVIKEIEPSKPAKKPSLLARFWKALGQL